MKKMLFIFMLGVVFLYSHGYANDIVKISKSEFEFLNHNVTKKQEELFGLQLDIKKPIDFKYYDDGILTNNFFPFVGFKGQGEILFEIENVESFVCYLNDKKIDTTNICKNKFSKLKIKNLVRNGKNILYVANIIAKKYNGVELIPKIHIKTPYPKLLKTKIKTDGVFYDALNLVDLLIQSEVNNGFPSIQLVIVKDGKIIKSSHYGKIYNSYNDKITLAKTISVTDKTLYDLASNTKIYATTFALQHLVYEKKISLNDKISDFFSEFVDSDDAKFTGKSEITVKDLLTHTSGFRAGGAYYQRRQVIKAKSSGVSAKAVTFDLIMKTPLSYPPHTQVLYSDINFMLLTFVIEKVVGMPLDEYVLQNIYQPVGLNQICFKPLDSGFSKNEIAGTVIGESRHKKGERYQEFAHGRVHDPESFFAMDEVSGHAGLFANAESLAVLAQIIINGGGYGTTKLFDLNTIDLFMNHSSLKANHAMGWRIQGDLDYSWIFSGLANSETIGHTGWTGTMTLIDRKNNLIVIMCTNAKHSNHLHSINYEGDYYLAKGYGAITSIIYSALLTEDKALLDSMLIELAEKKFDMLKLDSTFSNMGYYKDLKAIMETVKRRSLRSLALRKFLKTEKSKKIKRFLKENL